MSQAESLLTPFDYDAVIADKGYDSDPLRELLAAQQVEVVIPSRRYRKQPRDYDRMPLPRTQPCRTFHQQNQVVSTHFHSL